MVQEERLVCPRCGLDFVLDDITSENELGQDLCPACNEPVAGSEGMYEV